MQFSPRPQNTEDAHGPGTEPSLPRNVVLIGMPGAGKSTLGVVAAKMLGYDFVDGDLLIQNRQGATLQQIIDREGPEGFIRIEGEVLGSISCERSIVSPGGSAVYSEGAMRHLADIGCIVYLHVDPSELEGRLGGLVERGVVMRKGIGMTLEEIYSEREPLYRSWADVVLDVGGMNTREAASALASAVLEYGSRLRSSGDRAPLS